MINSQCEKHKKNNQLGDIIIEIRGGCLVAAYTGNSDQRIILIDWDNIKKENDEHQSGFIFWTEIFLSMPDETRSAYQHAIAKQ